MIKNCISIVLFLLYYYLYYIAQAFLYVKYITVLVWKEQLLDTKDLISKLLLPLNVWTLDQSLKFSKATGTQ